MGFPINIQYSIFLRTGSDFCDKTSCAANSHLLYIFSLNMHFSFLKFNINNPKYKQTLKTINTLRTVKTLKSKYKIKSPVCTTPSNKRIKTLK